MFFTLDRDDYHHKSHDYVNQFSGFDNYVIDCNNIMLCDEHKTFDSQIRKVGQVETGIVYTSDTSQYQCGHQYPNSCKLYLFQFTNRQFIDHNKGFNISLVFIQNIEKVTLMVSTLCILIAMTAGWIPHQEWT